MADVAASRPQNIPQLNRTTSRPPNIAMPIPARMHHPHLAVDTSSRVTQNGSFEFDRIVKQGEVLKRTRKTKSWKPIYMVLRPHILSIYRDKNESKLRHQITLADLTAVARQKDPKRKQKHVFGLFSPSRNFHLVAYSEAEAQDWVENIRREARIDQQEEEIFLASPGGATSSYSGFERSIDARIRPVRDRAESVGKYSSSDMEGRLSSSLPVIRQRDRGPSNSAATATAAARQPSYAEYSGVDRGSLSDFSDSAGLHGTARLSALSLAPTADGRPSTSSARPTHLATVPSGSTTVLTRPSTGARSASQLSVTRVTGPDEAPRAHNPHDEERIAFNGWIYLLKSKSGVRQWKKVWLVLRPRALALYKDEAEYAALLVLPLEDIIDAVEIDPISKSKTTCLQVISEERNYRFCALGEEQLTKLLGTIKSLLVKRKAKEKEQTYIVNQATSPQMAA